MSLKHGLSFSERLYYSQGREFQSNAHCPVLINGIPPDLAERDDLIDAQLRLAFRCLVTSSSLMMSFGASSMAPGQDCGLLDGVVGALRVRQEFRGDNDAAGRSYSMAGGRGS
jgi:hypothetical protein